MSNRYRVFGELTVIDESGTEHHVAGRNADVLAVLLAALPESVSADRLIDEIWGERHLEAPEITLHTAMSRLRKVVGNDLVTTARGYKLAPKSVDYIEFEKLVAKADATGTLADATAATEDAWKSAPFSGFDDLPSVSIASERLRQLQQRVNFARLEKLLEEGHAPEVIAELKAVVDANPFDEEALGLYMRALDSAGRKREALATFREYEALLAEESGLEPSARIRELEVAILTDQLEPVEAPDRPLVPLDLQISYVTVLGDTKIAVGRSGSGPPVFIHTGWMSKLDMIASGLDLRTPLWGTLTESHEVILFDRAKTGLSRDNDVEISFENGVEEIGAVLKATLNEPAPALAGSAAGPLIIRAALDNPGLFSHLILYGTYASGPATFPPAVANSMVALVRASWGMGSDVLTNLLFPSAPIEVREAWASRQQTITDSETAALLLRQMYDADVSVDLHRLDIPCLVIHYREDKAIPIRGGEHLARDIPNARFVPLEGMTHYPLPGEEPKVVERIDQFLGTQGT